MQKKKEGGCAVKTFMESPLFKDLSEQTIRQVFDTVGARRKHYEKGQVVLFAGDEITSMGLVVSGRLLIEDLDASGNRVVFAKMDAGEPFGASYALTGTPAMVDVVASEKSEVLFIDMERFLSCSDSLEAGKTLTRNLLRGIAEKNMVLSRKIRSTSGKTIREKLCTYLKEESLMAGKEVFEIPFDRQTLAEYIGCDRSQLSKALTGLQREGLINIHKNRVRVLF